VSRNTDTVFTRSNLSEAEVKIKAMDSSVYSIERLRLVRDYYLDTGTRLPYLNDNNKEIIFMPDDTAVKLHDATIKLKVAKANVKITALSLMGIMIVSAMLFSIFLWHRFPQQSQNQV